MLDVLSLLRTTRREKRGDVEQLARRLHDGEQIDPSDILAALAACGATDDELQAQLERLERIGSLRDHTKQATTARRSLDKLEAEQKQLADKWAAASEALKAWQAKHDERLRELRSVIDRADRAADDVLRSENLGAADRAACEAAAADIAEAGQQHSKLRRELDDIDSTIGHSQHALDQLGDVEGSSRLMPPDPETKQQADRLQAKIKRLRDRKAKLAGEISKAAKQLSQAKDAEVALHARIRREVLQ